MQKSVLVVEDEVFIAIDLQFMLEANGWRVIGPVATVRDALRLIERELPAAALLDVNLGTELITPVAEVLKSRGVPFALASAYDHPEQYGGMVLAGAPNVGKPSSEYRVVSIMEQILATA